MSLATNLDAVPPLFVVGRWSIEINTCAGDTVSASFLVCFTYKKLRHKLVRGGSAVSRYEQFETSPVAIEQELQPAVCKQRGNYSIHVHVIGELYYSGNRRIIVFT